MKLFNILILVYITGGLFMAFALSKKRLNFLNYTKEDWADFFIDLLIGTPMLIKFIIQGFLFFIRFILKSITFILLELWRTLIL